jgi:hypothetical protein
MVIFSRLDRAAIALAAALALGGCAHSGKQPDRDGADVPPKSLGGNSPEDGPMPGQGTVVVGENGEILVRGMKLKNTQFDYPITVNTRVEYWIDYFTGRGRPHFTKYLERSDFFVPYIRPLLKQSGLPEDLVYLAMIESGFNNHARSSAKAVGPWQFITGTGKRYGLMVNWWVDERRDIRKSTLSAVGYLRDLHGIFGNWELAAAAYNAGEAKVARAVQRYGSKDFWTITRHKFLRPETRDYVPKIIAAALISKNRAQFGFPEPDVHPAAGEAIAGDGEVVKVVQTDKPEEELKREEAVAKAAEAAAGPGADDDDDTDSGQPGARPQLVDDAAAATLITAELLTPASRPNGENAPLAKPVATPHVTREGIVGGEDLAEFDVQSPADLLTIARAAGLSYKTVKSLNPEILRWCTPPSAAAYRIKLPVSVKDRFLSTYNSPSFPRKVQFLAYKVRGGESISHVARRFGLKRDPIADLNRVSPNAPLRAGTTVLIPVPADRTRSLASLDVLDPPERRKRRSRRGRKLYRVSYKKRDAARSDARGFSGG